MSGFEIGACPADVTPRPMWNWERELVAHVLSLPFPGSAELRLQTRDAVVRTILPNGTFEFTVTHGPRVIRTTEGPVIEGSYTNEPDHVEHFLFLQSDGFLSELELVIYSPNRTDFV